MTGAATPDLRGSIWYRIALAFPAVVFITAVTLNALHKVPDTDEFSLFFGAATHHFFADIPNNPPLFNLLAGLAQLLPPPWPFFLPAVATAIAAGTLVRVGTRAGVKPACIAMALLVYLPAWIDVAMYYRSYALLIMFLALALEAWDRGDTARFFVWAFLASMTHHLGSFVGVTMVVASWVVRPRLPWWILLAFVPGLSIAASGFALKHQVATWGVPLSQALGRLSAGIALPLFLLVSVRNLGPLRQVAWWSLVQYGVLLALWALIPMQNTYLWIALAPSTLLLSALFELALAQRRRSETTFRVATAIVVLVSVVVGALAVAGQRDYEQQLAAFAQELRARYADRQKVLFYPNSDVSVVHYALAGFRTPERYTLEGLRGSVGPFHEVPTEPTSAGANAELLHFEAPNGARLDVAPFARPFTVASGYDCLVLHDSYESVVAIPAGYILYDRFPRFSVFVSVPLR